MQQLIQDSTRKLLNHQSKLCVSMFVPAHNVEVFKANFLRLWNDAWRVTEDRYDQEELAAVFSRLQLKALLAKVNPEYDTICVFASRRGVYFVYLDLKIEARVVIDQSFYLKPLVLTLSGDDQYWLLEVHKDSYVLSLAGLSGATEHLIVSRALDGVGFSRDIKLIVHLLNATSKPWFIGGAVEDVQEARLELSRAKLVKSPCAHILHSDRSRVQESAREVVRLRAKQESKLVQSDLAVQNIRPLVGNQLRANELSREGFKTIVVDSVDAQGSDAYSKMLGLDYTSEDLRVDDFLETALLNNLKVVAVEGLKDQIGTPIAAIKGKEAGVR